VNLRISRSGAIGLALACLLAAALFMFLLARFGGPSVRLSEPYRVSAVVDDTRGLVSRSEVMVRGVRVGEVETVDADGDRARVTLALDARYAPLHRDTTVRVGAKTLFGESYVDLDPGTPAAPEIASGAELPGHAVLPAAVDVDQALSAFGPETRSDLDAVIQTSGAGAAAGSERVSATLAEIARTTSELRGLVETLAGQEDTIADGVEDAGALASALAADERILRAIVADGRTALTALADRGGSLRAGSDELPRLIGAARTTLAGLRPLVIEARPLVGQLATAAPDLRSALAELPAAAGDADRLLARVPELERVATPFLADAEATLKLAAPVSGPLSDALRNAEPIAGFLSDRREAFAAWFSNTADLGSHRDAKGYFARFFVGFEPSTAFGLPGGNYRNNSYTGPGDAADPQPYSGYPRLEPYDPYGAGDG
jgi:phospholipid/cholesterol/gamma-HCH transport system substrate-binding protein